MWLFIVFYILGLHTSQATGQDNSTQMYYAKLTIDESAIENITALLKPFMKDSDVYVDDLSKTTICQSNLTNRICECEPGFIWTNKICEPLKCCNNISCTFSKDTDMCVSNKSVTIRGILTLQGDEYFPCLDTGDKRYQNCTTILFTEMKKVYSTLSGFNILKILSYRLGSVIVDFEMAFAQNINIAYLQSLTVNLGKSLLGKLKMETAGVVTLQMPNKPVCQDKQHSITCTVKEPLVTQEPPKWELEREGQKFEITNGTESEVTIEPLETKIKLNNISELWEGEYTCLYIQTSEYYTITHKAKSVLDAKIKAKIDITVAPSFPYCTEGIDSLIVQITCQTQNKNESLIVTWKSPDIKIVQKTYTTPGTYTASVVVDCKSVPSYPNITCSFNDTCNQVSTATTDINIIRVNDTFCKDDGDWKNTKAGFTARLQCKDSTGQRQRYCDSSGKWEAEVSGCVNNEVTNVLQKATIVDIGLGIANDNVAQVFSLLGKVTNDSKSINTFANMNATIAILDTLSKKNAVKPNSTATNDFLESSSNLLDRSLKASWETKPKGDEKPLADVYLSSVEKLIKVADITNAPKKKNIEVAERSCTQLSNCTNKVFNVTVKLESSVAVKVKTAGFLELDKYLPNNNTEFSPNSIVVSTTTDNKQKSPVSVRITFELLKQRPRNVDIQCVYWDGNRTGWSREGCTWQGPSSETECVCEHLSSFAILMSKYPLNITGLTEITYAGLSVSVISLVINLLIELTIWNAVVKTNTLYLRHTAHVNISLCLLIADCCFLASSEPKNISEIMCGAFVVLKHFCYLSMFFWMLCLSSTLLHQAIFLFHNVSKKTYLRFSIVLGYVCPLLIVAVSLLVYMAGGKNKYYSYDTCWLVYDGFMKGSIYTFVIPVGIIVFINVFSMVVVIMKLLDHPKNVDKSHDKEKKAAITVVRSVVLLTPVFGLTWIFGFAVMLIDLTSGNIAYVVNYTFTLLNAFQGLFILLTTCLGDKLTREALLNRLTSKTNTHASTNDSTTKLESTMNK
ncbi:adhesion G-protein coupled receptor F3 [Morone saxatilis]|uniref:adhesion G-protein coupled receptor F3 n=1 Tax=Morone saxatilis TaxID=34816 RepID=UPI0015E1F56B|nr:adhesion G-protein coupled receptor F3 [Morone saxatilis]